MEKFDKITDILGRFQPSADKEEIRNTIKEVLEVLFDADCKTAIAICASGDDCWNNPCDELCDGCQVLNENDYDLAQRVIDGIILHTTGMKEYKVREPEPEEDDEAEEEDDEEQKKIDLIQLLTVPAPVQFPPAQPAAVTFPEMIMVLDKPRTFK